jgi:hypothetical protein
MARGDYILWLMEVSTGLTLRSSGWAATDIFKLSTQITPVGADLTLLTPFPNRGLDSRQRLKRTQTAAAAVAISKASSGLPERGGSRQVTMPIVEGELVAPGQGEPVQFLKAL